MTNGGVLVAMEIAFSVLMFALTVISRGASAMRNKGIKVGDKYRGMVNGIEFEVIRIRDFRKYGNEGIYVTLKEIKTGKGYEHTYDYVSHLLLEKI